MNTRIEPIELTDDELKAVAGGSLSATTTNSNINNSFNGSGNTVVAASNSLNNLTNSSVSVS